MTKTLSEIGVTEIVLLISFLFLVISGPITGTILLIRNKKNKLN